MSKKINQLPEDDDFSGDKLTMSGKSSDGILMRLTAREFHGVKKYVTSEDVNFELPTDRLLDKIVIGSDEDMTIKIGITDGGEDVLQARDIAAGARDIIQVNYDPLKGSPIFFNGISGNCNIILIFQIL